MFVLRTTYEKEFYRRAIAEKDYQDLLVKWNELVVRINAKGDEYFLGSPQKQPLTKGEITKMIALCHPDKHNGSDTANEVTARLLTLRKSF